MVGAHGVDTLPRRSSPDLAEGGKGVQQPVGKGRELSSQHRYAHEDKDGAGDKLERQADAAAGLAEGDQTIDRQSDASGKSVSLRVDLGGRRIIKTTTCD